MEIATPHVIDPLEELQLEIEEVAQDPTLDEVTRSARLTEFRSDVVGLLGTIDTYLGDNAEEADGGDPDTDQAIAQMRENADIRERLIATGQATAETCDDLLLISHQEIDRLAEENLLEESALHAVSFMRGLNAKFEEDRHPRGRGGKWIDVLNKVAKLKEGERVDVGHGVRIHHEGEGKMSVRYRGRKVSGHTSPEHAVKSAQAIVERRESGAKRPEVGAPPRGIGRGDRVSIKGGEHDGKKGEVISHNADGSLTVRTDDGKNAVVPATSARREVKKTEERSDWIRAKEDAPHDEVSARRTDKERAAERDLPPEEKKKVYDQRKKELEERAAEAVKRAAAAGKLTDAEAHFNEAGKVSQRTLANYVEEAGTQPQTIDRHSTVTADGRRVWDRSRQQLHEKIITAVLSKRKIDPESGKEVLDFSPEAEPLQPHPEGPQVLFSGGGYAAGKGASLKILGAQGQLPPDSFTLDPDQIKALLPEFQDRIGSDPEANMLVYREAWAVAQEIQARAMEKKLNIVVDGISNTAPEEMGQRLKAFTDRGYKARVVYTDIPTEEAMKRAAHRAENAKDDSDRRMIPETIMRSVHRDVAATVPSLPGYLEDHQIPAQVDIFDNNQGQDETGAFRPPKQFFSWSPEGGREVHDQELWDRFVQKGHEPIAHVEGASAR